MLLSFYKILVINFRECRIQSSTESGQSQEILRLINNMAGILEFSDRPIKEEIEDDLEILSEQLQSPQPRKGSVAKF